MIRCINITEPYFDDKVTQQCWVFLNTTSDEFLRTESGVHVFWYDDIVAHPQSARLLSLLPKDEHTMIEAERTKTITIWRVELFSQARGVGYWSRRFTALPTPGDLNAVLQHELNLKNTEANVPALETFIDLVTRLPEDYAKKAKDGGHAIRAARVIIGRIHLTSKEAYEI